MNIILLNIKNPQWKTIKSERLDSDGNVVNDTNGNPIMDVVNDSDGNPVRVINCECQWSHLGDETQEWLTFTANPNDTEEHGKQLYQDLIDGKHGEIADD